MLHILFVVAIGIFIFTYNKINFKSFKLQDYEELILSRPDIQYRRISNASKAGEVAEKNVNIQLW